MNKKLIVIGTITVFACIAFICFFFFEMWFYAGGTITIWAIFVLIFLPTMRIIKKSRA